MNIFVLSYRAKIYIYHAGNARCVHTKRSELCVILCSPNLDYQLQVKKDIL